MLRAKLFTGTLHLNIEVVSPLLIKAGSNVGISPLSPDMECIRTMRDGVSQVYIPGTSLKGVIRSHAYRLLSSEDNAMFGSTTNAGRFFFSDAYSTAENIKIGLRSNTKINPNSGAAANTSLRSFEVVESGTFQTRIDWINISIRQLGLIMLVLNEFDAQIINLGSGGSKGMGYVQMHYQSMTLNYPTCMLQNNSLYCYSVQNGLNQSQLYGIGSLVVPNQRAKYKFPDKDFATLPMGISYQPAANGLGVSISLTNSQQITDIRQACLECLTQAVGENNV